MGSSDRPVQESTHVVLESVVSVVRSLDSS